MLIWNLSSSSGQKSKSSSPAVHVIFLLTVSSTIDLHVARVHNSREPYTDKLVSCLWPCVVATHRTTSWLPLSRRAPGQSASSSHSFFHWRLRILRRQAGFRSPSLSLIKVGSSGTQLHLIGHTTRFPACVPRLGRWVIFTETRCGAYGGRNRRGIVWCWIDEPGCDGRVGWTHTFQLSI